MNISVIMAVYNDSEYLAESINSILEQSYTDFEFIIVDDCSTDGCDEIIKHYSKIDQRIIQFQNEKNTGLPSCLNFAITKSKGRFIARMDGDDISHPDRLDKQLAFMNENTGIDICGTGIVYIDSDGVEVGKADMPLTHNEIKKTINRKSPFAHPSVLIRKEFFENYGGYDETLRRKQDYDLWSRGMINGAKYSNLPDHLVQYRFPPKKSFTSDLYGFRVRIRYFITTGNILWLIFALYVLALNVIRKLLPRSISEIVFRS